MRQNQRSVPTLMHVTFKESTKQALLIDSSGDLAGLWPAEIDINCDEFVL